MARPPGPNREETVRSKKPKGVMLELWAIGLAYNLVRLEIESIAEQATVPRTPRAVMAAPVAGGEARVLAGADATGYGTVPGLGSRGFVAPLRMDSSFVYTVDGLNIVRIAKATGVSSTLVTAEGPISALAVGDMRIYWAESSTTGNFAVSVLKSAPLAGGDAIVLADDFFYVLPPEPVMSDIVVTQTNLLWAANGTLWRLSW